MKHTLETLPEATGPGDTIWRGTKDLFFIRPFSPRIGDVADFPNTEKQAQSHRKMRRWGNLSQINEQDKTMARDLSETDIINTHDENLK